MIQKLIDLRSPASREALHDLLAETFGFPAYYGKNLDALYDMLTDICEDTCVGVFPPESPDCPADGAPNRFSGAVSDCPAGQTAAGQEAGPDAPHEADCAYARRILEVMQDAAKGNRHLAVVLLR